MKNSKLKSALVLILTLCIIAGSCQTAHAAIRADAHRMRIGCALVVDAAGPGHDTYLILQFTHALSPPEILMAASLFP